MKNPFAKLSFLVLLACSGHLQSQQTSPQSQTGTKPNYYATVLEEDPVVDGEIINDPVWQMIPAITDLIQIRPNYGELVSEKTEVRIAYSSTTFYVSVICYDADADGIVVSDSRRDADLNDEDSFLFIIDTYHDRQNGFLFGTNAQGMEYDAQIDNEGKGNFNANRQQGGVIGGTNINWDATWKVRSQLGDYGWSAEFAIPFRSLRYAPGDNKTWGLNFQRNISKNTETAYWTSLPLGFDMKRLSLAGNLNGLNLRNPGNLKLIPYVLGQHVNDKAMDDTETNFDAGADIKYSVTPSLTLDLTYNTDFAQVEVDDQQVNLDRFNLFFPEKRAFFLENAGQFGVGSPGEVDLFFSRRIGIGDDGSLVPIIGGARLSGKVGQTNVGFLSMFTDDVVEAAIEKNNFTVARVNHNFGGTRSSLGGIFINRAGLGEMDDDYNRVYAMDGKWGIGNKATINGFVAKSVTPGIENGDHAFKLLGNYEWGGWNINAGYTEVGEGFNPEVGFLQRTAFRKPEFLVFKAHRFKDAGKLLEIRPHVSYRGYWNFDDELVTSFLHIDNHWVLKSGFEIHTGINFTAEQVFEEFTISDVTVPVGYYNNEELQLVITTNPNTALSFDTRTIIGGYFNGHQITNSGTAKYRIGDRFNSSLTMSHSDIQLDTGDLTALVGGLRLSYSFTPRIFIQSLIQRNNVSNITSVNARFGWLQNANTGLFVVFNVVKDDDLIDGIDNQTFTIKYTHRFDILN
ncbi:carbohydrate binding family 9 domain-containing protein [Muricauda sp. CAU 1633]|uniref:carbohydrate binding family 9 domain-containing protein n=1 Tax=Allomuricauda sp. CAU 1633 TaxID=2816036 RepID=UPI001A8FFCF5|nr:carbohydrate binding family 9 domain-containing protein [Muricauda sp. CAU 1633]MBO0323175.1 carbohydrate binding family 9 domain-containing protein [Muricauda sp. CAU 1633]